MSTGCECNFFEFEPGQWFYLLEDEDAPKDAWDWRDNAQCYGPFTTEATAKEHLDDNHANPGGYSVSPYVPCAPKEAILIEHVMTAIPASQRRFHRW